MIFPSFLDASKYRKLLSDFSIIVIVDIEAHNKKKIKKSG